MLEDFLQTRFELISSMMDEDSELRAMVVQYLGGRLTKKNRLAYRFVNHRYVVNPEQRIDNVFDQLLFELFVKEKQI